MRSERRQESAHERFRKLVFLLYYFGHDVDLSSPTRDQILAPAVEAWSFNPRTSREVPHGSFMSL